MKYGYKKQSKKNFKETIESVKKNLATEGFGVLTEIDVQAVLKKKLDINYISYVILGACNPNFAYKALEAEKDIGLLLPCNVIIYESEEGVYISAIKPSIAMSMVENESLHVIAKDVEQKLENVINNS